jgi:hypothetical protein
LIFDEDELSRALEKIAADEFGDLYHQLMAEGNIQEIADRTFMATRMVVGE